MYSGSGREAASCEGSKSLQVVNTPAKFLHVYCQCQSDVQISICSSTEMYFLKRPRIMVHFHYQTLRLAQLLLVILSVALMGDG